jgi:hypothetical protein
MLVVAISTTSNSLTPWDMNEPLWRRSAARGPYAEPEGEYHRVECGWRRIILSDKEKTLGH